MFHAEIFLMKKVVDKLIKYIGSDIVPELIAINNSKFSSEYRKFINKDLVKYISKIVWICRALFFI